MNERDKDSPTLPTANLEQDIGHAPLGEEKPQRCDTRACIHIHSIRERLADPDGISAKAVIDGLVKAGLLEDDSPDRVKEVTYTQEKGKEEKTIVTVKIEEA